MVTKLDYRMYNYRKLTTLLTMSLLHYYFFRAPFISNYSSDALHQTNLKDSIITITGINSVLLMLETTILCLFTTLINEVMTLCSNCYNNITFNKMAYSCNFLDFEYFNNRLDSSNPFLYSDKAKSLRE